MLRFRDVYNIVLAPDEIFIKIRIHNPFLEPKSLVECLRAKRRAMGLTIKDAAHRLRVDAGTWGDWERGDLSLRLLARLMLVSVCSTFNANLSGEHHECHM